MVIFFCMARKPYMGLGLLVSSRFHDHTHFRHTTVGRTPLNEGSARRRDLYLTTHNTHNRQTSMPSVGFEPTILVSERTKTHALDRTVTGIGIDNTQHSQQTDIHAPGGIRTNDPSKRADEDPRLRPHGHLDLLKDGLRSQK
jgi:hypothetical protein